MDVYFDVEVVVVVIVVEMLGECRVWACKVTSGCVLNSEVKQNGRTRIQLH